MKPEEEILDEEIARLKQEVDTLVPFEWAPGVIVRVEPIFSQVDQKAESCFSGLRPEFSFSMRTVGDLVADGSFASFSHLQVQCGLHRSNFFRYLYLICAQSRENRTSKV